MNKAETHKNWGLEELMSYVNSLTETKANLSYEESLSKITSIREENQKNWALEELMSYVNLLTEIKSAVSNDNSLNQVITAHNDLGEVTEISQDEIVLSTSNLADLIALIQDLRLSKLNLVKEVNYLSQSITDFHQDIESYKVQLHTASLQISKQNQELEASYQTIEKLTKQLASSQELVAIVQGEYQEQSYQLSVEKDVCRDLRTRLNREKQHSLQLKVALEKCLEVPTVNSPLADNYQQKKAYNNDLENSTNFAPKAPPIQPWKNQTIATDNKIDLSWEYQKPQVQSNPEVEETIDCTVEYTDNKIDLSWEHQAQSNPKVEEITDCQPTGFTTEYTEPFNNLPKEKLNYTDEIQGSSPIEINWTKPPSPIVYPSRQPKGRKTLAAIELPSFIA